jgi:hypothetical protein
MASVVSNLPRQRGQPVDDDRLLDLFWNRAELKKAFAEMRAERHNLRERIRQQEGQILRAQQRVEELEGVLADPTQAANAGVFFQLRALWGYGRRRLMRLSRDLATHERERTQRAGQQAFESGREAELAELDRSLAQTREQVRQAQQIWMELARRRRGLLAWFGIGPGRDELDVAQEAVTNARLERDRIEQLRKSKLHEAAPDGGELDLASRRRINLAVVALAQELFLHFDEDDLAAQAREAISRQLVDVDYGTASACRRLSRAIAERLQTFEAVPDLPARIRRRARYLVSCARYRLETDAVPTTGCFTTMPRLLDDAGQPVDRRAVATNVLTDEYWDLYSVLLS